MMLQALVALAEREGLLLDTSYGKRRVHYRLVIDDSGRFLSLIPLGENDKGQELQVPAAPKRTAGVAPAFLVDNSQYVFGFPKVKKGSAVTSSAQKRAKECLNAYVEVIQQAAKLSKDPGLIAVERFLHRVIENPNQLRSEIVAAVPDHEWTGDETIAFWCSEDSQYVHDRPEVRTYWAARQADPNKTRAQRCLITGEWTSPARLHPPIKRIPEAQPAGASLVSFNQPAFTSQDWDQGDNAPVSRRAAEGYARALNWLLEADGERRFRSGIAVGSDAVLVFWTKDKNETPDVLRVLFDPDAPTPEDARAIFESAIHGLRVRSEIDATKFYALTISGNVSRVVVRDWLETTAAEVKRNLASWFDDLALHSDDTSPLSVYRLLRALEATPSGNDRRGIPSPLAARMLRSAMRGTPLPRTLLQAALWRLRVPPREGEWRGTLRARVALIKAVLLRLNIQSTKEVTVALDETNSSVPYLLGRLFAALEKLQADALGDVNATIRDRYFGAASATPVLVFPRLLRVSMHHASKAESAGHGYIERIKSEIINRLPAGEPFPPTLDLEEQGLFAVGYYHQRQSFFTKRTVTQPKADVASA